MLGIMKLSSRQSLKSEGCNRN